MYRTRRVVATTAFLSLVLAACGGGDTTTDPTTQEPESPTVTVAPTEPGTASPTEAETTYETVSLSLGIQEGAASNLPTVVAREQGMFDTYGLEVEFVPLAGSALLGAVASGDVQFFSQAVQLVGTAIQQGVELNFFCGGSSTNWSVMLAPADSGLPTAADGATWQEVMQALEGKTLGVAALGATQEHWVRALAEAAGANADAITLLPIGVGPPAMAAYESGQVDAMIGYSFLKEQLYAKGDTVELFAFDDTGPEVLGDQMNTGFVADKAWLDANPDVAHRVCDSLTEATEWFQDEANADEVREILQGPDFAITDEAVLDEILEGRTAIDTFDPEIDCTRLELAAEFFVDFGTFQAEPPVNCETAVWSG